ncbi:transmembrane protein 231-domain-containing protein [Zopfochytrium polystomum]|nr:transmembrane protein 231-domain-containing protein [Zopfochytrium polystomum]
MPTFYAIPFQRRFRAPICSRASLLAAILSAAALIVPLIWAYSSHSFWLKENTFREQPTVKYQRELMLFLDGQSTVDGSRVHLFFSTNPQLSQLFDSAMEAVPSIKTAEVDEDRDGINDYLSFTIQTHLQDSYDIHHVRLAMMFRYELVTDIRLLMQSMAYFDESSPLPISAIDIDGDLQLVQRELLDSGVDNVRYNVPVVNYTLATVGDTSALSWGRILRSYLDRDIYTAFSHPPPTYTFFRATHQPLTITGKLRYPEHRIAYRPGVTEVLKFGWIQYLAHFAVAATVAWWVYGWCLRSQLVPTCVVVDVIPKPVGGGGTSGMVRGYSNRQTCVTSVKIQPLILSLNSQDRLSIHFILLCLFFRAVLTFSLIAVVLHGLSLSFTR